MGAGYVATTAVVYIAVLTINFIRVALGVDFAGGGGATAVFVVITTLCCAGDVAVAVVGISLFTI